MNANRAAIARAGIGTTRGRWRAVRGRLSVRAIVAAGLLLVAVLDVACGGGDSAPAPAEAPQAATTAPALPDETAAAPASVTPASPSPGDDVDAAASQAALAPQGFPAQCPSTNASFNAQNAATYQIFGELPIRMPDGSSALNYIFIGTAWSVRERLLVTNAHVVAAFEDTAVQGVQLSRVLAVQSGTGLVVRLLRSFMHPDYTGAPLTSPDVGLFIAEDALPDQLRLAPATSVLGLGDDIQIVGFPGDVEDFITTQPGSTIPQATSLLGTISSRRSHDDTEAVVQDTLDVYQYQAPTTPGTSGSSIVSCGLVAGINNAGTVNLVVSPSATRDGDFEIVRQAAASNNFGVHVKHIHNLIDLFDADELVSQALPVVAALPPTPPATTPPATSPPAATPPVVPPPVTSPPATPPVVPPPAQEDPAPPQPPTPAPTLVGGVTDPGAQHDFQITIDALGLITGQSSWATGPLTLSGRVAVDGSVQFTDDAPERLGFRRGVYQGQVAADGTITGVYFEQSQEDESWPFTTRIP